MLLYRPPATDCGIHTLRADAGSKSMMMKATRTHDRHSAAHARHAKSRTAKQPLARPKALTYGCENARTRPFRSKVEPLSPDSALEAGPIGHQSLRDPIARWSPS